jgi:hypothetical protein
VLKPTSRLESLVHLAVELVPVLDRALQITDVDKVKDFWFKGPFHLGVVDLEFQVGWHERWLCWGNVGGDDFG